MRSGRKEVTSRKGRVSRNILLLVLFHFQPVTSRKGRVSRNEKKVEKHNSVVVTSRKGRVSRNFHKLHIIVRAGRHVPQGACE